MTGGIKPRSSYIVCGLSSTQFWQIVQRPRISVTAWQGTDLTDKGEVTCNESIQLRVVPASPHWHTRMASVRKALKNIASGNRHYRLQPPSTSDDNSAAAAELELVALPNALPKQYPPLILIHVILLAAALLLLPQTPIPNLPLPAPARGLDKPQHPFLAPITARPVLTLVWACLGAVLLVPWWAGSLRRWAHDGTLGSRSAQQRLAGNPHKQRVRPVLSFCFCTSRLLTLTSPTGHPECLCLHRIRDSGVARRDNLIWCAILSVRLYVTASCHTRSLTDALRFQVRATYRAASFAPCPLHHLSSRIRAWSTTPWSPTPLRTRRRCGRAERPLDADICGTRVSDSLDSFRASSDSFSYDIRNSP